MGNDINISQNEIDALFGTTSPASTTVDTPPAPPLPPPIEQAPPPSPTPSLNNSHAEPISYQNLSDSKAVGTPSEIDLVKDIPLEISVELGKTKKSIQEILDFGLGTVVELNRLAGEPVDLLANGKTIAKGEVVVIDENFALRITEISKEKQTR